MAFFANAQQLAKGEKQTILERIEVSGSSSSMVMGLTDIPANETKDFHIHNFPEVAYVLEGEITIFIQNGKSFSVKKGESFQIKPDIKHKTKAGPKGAQVLFTILSKK